MFGIFDEAIYMSQKVHGRYVSRIFNIPAHKVIVADIDDQKFLVRNFAAVSYNFSQFLPSSAPCCLEFARSHIPTYISRRHRSYVEG